ncbi:MAG: DNA polymerase III subunit gamma/tau [Enterobacterales bacterium]
MNYNILARKWRPKNFSEVIGQENIIKLLTNSLNSNKIHHAYLFSGMQGIGKTTIARLFAKNLNCKNYITSTSCNTCSNCCDFKKSKFIDLIEVDAASKTKVEDIKEILDDINYLPVQGKFKIYLIDEVHMLSRYSFNSLLKILEEPPYHIKFLLATTDPQKIPLTILSRCLHLYLKPISINNIIKYLTKILIKESIKVDYKSLFLIAYHSNGSVRDALNLLDQAIAIGNNKINESIIHSILGILDINCALSLIESLLNYDGNKIFEQIDKFSKFNVNWDILLSNMLVLLHQISCYQLFPNNIITQNKDILYKIQILSLKIKPTDVQLYYQMIINGRKELPYAPSPRLGLEMTMLRMLTFTPNYLIIQKQDFDKIQTIKKKNLSNNKKLTNYFDKPKKIFLSKKNKNEINDINNHTLKNFTVSTYKVLRARLNILSNKKKLKIENDIYNKNTSIDNNKISTPLNKNQPTIINNNKANIYINSELSCNNTTNINNYVMNKKNLNTLKISKIDKNNNGNLLSKVELDTIKAKYGNNSVKIESLLLKNKNIKYIKDFFGATLDLNRIKFIK